MDAITTEFALANGGIENNPFAMYQFQTIVYGGAFILRMVLFATIIVITELVLRWIPKKIPDRPLIVLKLKAFLITGIWGMGIAIVLVTVINNLFVLVKLGVL